MGKLIRKHPRYELYNLPKLKTGAFIYINANGLRNKGFTGSVISRLVPNSVGIYKHYGVIYGFDENETLWIIENNLDGVECITFDDFLNEQNIYEIQCLANPSASDMILSRAKEKSLIPYNARSNNCEHFKNYCTTGIHYSEQSDNTIDLANIFLSLFEMKILVFNNIEFYDTFTKFREVVKIKRIPGFQESLEKLIEQRRDYKLPSQSIKPSSD